jgi:hypothetical protein
MRPSLVALAAAAALVLAASRAAAVDPFEIQVYDGTADSPGSPGLELHVNRVFSGLTTSTPPELPQNGQTHFTLEPSLGLTPFWEIGGYFETTLRADGVFDYAGVKLRSKFVTPRGWMEHLRLGLNLEVSFLPTSYDRDQWGMEIRPIVAWENELWLFVVNPIVDLSLAGPDYPAGPTFQPAAMAKVKILEKVAVGVEYYADFGPFSGFLPVSQEEHYLFEAADLLAVKNFELNVGVGEGLTAGSNAFVGKMIVGYEWDRQDEAAQQPGQPAPQARRAGWLRGL